MSLRTDVSLSDQPTVQVVISLAPEVCLRCLQAAEWDQFIQHSVDLDEPTPRPPFTELLTSKWSAYAVHAPLSDQ